MVWVWVVEGNKKEKKKNKRKEEGSSQQIYKKIITLPKNNCATSVLIESQCVIGLLWVQKAFYFIVF